MDVGACEENLWRAREDVLRVRRGSDRVSLVDDYVVPGGEIQRREHAARRKEVRQDAICHKHRQMWIDLYI